MTDWPLECITDECDACIKFVPYIFTYFSAKQSNNSNNHEGSGTVKWVFSMKIK